MTPLGRVLRWLYRDRYEIAMFTLGRFRFILLPLKYGRGWTWGERHMWEPIRAYGFSKLALVHVHETGEWETEQ